jgi:tetratricopeptide (TPR) repeat protein
MLFPEGVDVLRQRIEADAGDAAARCQLAVLLLAEYGLYGTEEGPALLGEARALLTRSIALDATHAPAHALLGYTCDLIGDVEPALASLREARRMDPKNKTVDVYATSLLVALEREDEALAEIEAMAPRHRLNLEKLRAELAKVGFPADAGTLLMNGFIHGRNFFRSWMSDEAERIRNTLQRGRRRRVAKEELDRCKEDQRRLQRDFDRSRVPASIRSLAGAASTYGVGDDVCRPLLMKRIPKAERAKLIRKADKLAAAIDKWLDTFPTGKMSDEAAAFMYFMNGIEEIR